MAATLLLSIPNTSIIIVKNQNMSTTSKMGEKDIIKNLSKSITNLMVNVTTVAT